MDWKKLLEELTQAGWSQARIADHCGVGQATVSDLQRGSTKEPRFGLGSKLVALHVDVMGQSSADEESVQQPTPQA